MSRRAKLFDRAKREAVVLEQLDWIRTNRPHRFDALMKLLAQLVAEGHRARRAT